MSASRSKVLALVAGAVVLVVASSASSAVATRLITGADIKDRSITGADIRPESVPGNRLEQGSVRLEHLDESAARMGYVYTSKAPASRSSSGRESRSVDFPTFLSVGASATVASLGGLPESPYVVMVEGQISLQASAAGQTRSMCTLSVGGADDDHSFEYDVPNGMTSGFYPANVSFSKAVLVPDGAAVKFSCTAWNSGLASGMRIGTVWADIYATPVTTTYDLGG